MELRRPGPKGRNVVGRVFVFCLFSFSFSFFFVCFGFKVLGFGFGVRSFMSFGGFEKRLYDTIICKRFCEY